MNAMIPDLYGPTHRTARMALSDFLVRASAADCAEPEAFQRILRAWKQLSTLLDAQSFCEDIHIHPMLHVAAPELAMALDRQHEAIGRAMRNVGAVLFAVDGLTDPSARRIAAGEAYVGFTALMSEVLLHLVEEETRAMPLLVDRSAPPTLFGRCPRRPGKPAAELPGDRHAGHRPARPPQDVVRPAAALRDAA